MREKCLKISKAVFFVAALCSSTAYAQSMRCITGATVVGVGVGYKDNLMGCPDSANCIYIKYKNPGSTSVRTIGINAYYNLNDDDRGIAFVSLLKTAMLTGTPITAWDHNGTMCDDIDEIVLGDNTGQV